MRSKLHHSSSTIMQDQLVISWIASHDTLSFIFLIASKDTPFV